MSAKKNIALFTYDLDYGGTERVVSRLANELVKYYNVTVILLFNKVNYKIASEVKLVALANKKTAYASYNPVKWIQYLSFLLKYEKYLKENQIAVSVSFLAVPNIINGYTKSNYPKIKTLISERCYPSKTYTGFFKKNIRKILFKKYYNNNNLLFSNSKYINQDLKENFNVKISSEVIYNPIVQEDSDYTFNLYYGDTFRVVSLGRLVPVKNFQGIIKAVAKLDADVTLNIYGNGILESPLKSLIKSLHTEHKTTVNQPVLNVFDVLKTHHCFVLNSHTEGFPNALLEAMSIGLPVISTNCLTGPLELLNDDEPVSINEGEFYNAKYGILINTNDVVALSKAITYLKNNENIREKYSKLGFERSKNYSIKNIGLQVKNLIDSI
ncbi:MAG TPA: glycosyltransferase [Flavobacteriaceae bacterium]|nr:glycosyltransferase [Flavobacteriaceae bacterium]